MIIVKNSRSVVCEMSMMLAFASASTADTFAMMPTLSSPMTVTMIRFDLLCMRIPEEPRPSAHSLRCARGASTRDARALGGRGRGELDGRELQRLDVLAVGEHAAFECGLG